MNHDKPPQLPTQDDWNRAGWDMDDLDKYGSRARAHGHGSGHNGQTTRHRQAQPTPWLTLVTVLSGLLVLTGGFNMAFTLLTLFMDGPHELYGGARLAFELLFSGFITWAYYGVALHQHKGRKRIIPFVMFKLGMCVLGLLASFLFCIFSLPAGLLGVAFFGAFIGFFGLYLYALQRLDVAAHFTH